jgi:hypothetical protein
VPVRLTILIALLAVLLAAPLAAAQSGVLGEAATALQSDSVYVHPDANPSLTQAEVAALRARITERDAGPMYIAVLPERAASEAGGSVGQALTQLGSGVGRPGTYVLVAGRTFRAGSTRGIAPEGATPKAADAALKAKRGEGLDAILLDFVDRMGEVRAGNDPGDSGGNGGGGGGEGTLIVLGALALGGGGLVLARRRRRQREEAAELEEVRDTVRADVVQLGEEIRALDLDIQMPTASQEAKADYEQALGAYERASAAVDRARRPEDLEPVGQAAEEGRFAMASARARLEGREPPARTPPCFFDPRHGPSSREVEWSPPWGEPRMVPACEADAQRVERGEDPDPREVTVGGQRVPYWNAGPAYAPYMGGFFGGGLLPGIFLGSLLGGGMFGGGYGGWGGEYGGEGGTFGDGGGGDFGGGDFGGGGFGGGDFGGGGGDFGGGDF